MEPCVHCHSDIETEIVPCQLGEEWHCSDHIQQCAYCGFRGCYLEFVTYDICAECAEKQIAEAEAADIHPYYREKEEKNMELVEAAFWAVIIISTITMAMLSIKGCHCLAVH